ncbi:hypothetical protein [Sphingosinicella humi]|uniref:Uncharacterized protein n=1 Tax=Allosphingosinicella humi TaxID=2068657 RepID=A0A2U2IZ22_9SPHN|nr:hypothetical protein [Sphingosinicella humi]PWG01324.1 hypothetical protein DF286_14460 [Sphingosinicella humi]
MSGPSEQDEEEDIPFTPVPVRARRDGWTEARQRGFIRALRRIGSAAAAARSVGKSARGAHKLRSRPGAESFAAAWDEAAALGHDNLRDHVIDRALHGAVVPRFRAGRQVGVAHRYYDALAIAVLSGRGAGLAERLRQAEERGARRSYFEIERAWRRHLEELKEERDRRLAAEGKLARLAEAGLIGREWLDPAAASPSLPSAARAAAAPPIARRTAPRITLL